MWLQGRLGVLYASVMVKITQRGLKLKSSMKLNKNALNLTDQPQVEYEVTCALWWSSRNTGDKTVHIFFLFFS